MRNLHQCYLYLSLRSTSQKGEVLFLWKVYNKRGRFYVGTSQLTSRQSKYQNVIKPLLQFGYSLHIANNQSKIMFLTLLISSTSNHFVSIRTYKHEWFKYRSWFYKCQYWKLSRKRSEDKFAPWRIFEYLLQLAAKKRRKNFCRCPIKSL